MMRLTILQRRFRTFALCVLLLGPLPLSVALVYAQKKTNAPDFDTLAKQAEAARDADRLDDAIALYKKALARNPQWAEGWFSLGTLEYDRDNYAAAAQAFHRLIPLAPKNGTARVMLGLCQFEAGQDASALKNIQDGRRLGISNNPQLREVTIYHEGVLLLRASKFKIAQETFGILCKDGIQTDQLFEGMGMAVMRMLPKEVPPAGTPGAAVVRGAGYGACLSKQKKFDQAHAEYNSLLTQFPSYPNLHYASGLDYVEANDVPAAVDQFKQELLRDPANFAAGLEIATTLYKVDSSAALEYAREVVKQKPNLPFPHYLLGLIYLDTDNHLKAIPELEIASKAFPQDARVFFALSIAYSKAGRKQEALKARANFERLSKLSNPDAKASY
jgi:tetratricopeptide (TPR) repeat protein